MGVGVMAVTMGVAVSMVMAVAVAVAVAVVVAVRLMVGAQGDGNAVGLTGAGAFPLTQVTAVGQSFDVMVMAFLGQADFIFEAENLGPVFAQ